MELKNIFKMTKTDRYTQDGRDQIAKLQETEDVKYKTGDISQKTGLQKQPDGSWAPPKGGAGKNVHGAEIDKIYEKHQKRIKELKAKGYTDEQIENDKIYQQTKEDMRNVGAAGRKMSKAEIGERKSKGITPADINKGKIYTNENGAKIEITGFGGDGSVQFLVTAPDGTKQAHQTSSKEQMERILSVNGYEGSKPDSRALLSHKDHIDLAKEVKSNTMPGSDWTAEEIAKEWKLGKGDAEEVKKEFDKIKTESKPAAMPKITERADKYVFNDLDNMSDEDKVFKALNAELDESFGDRDGDPGNVETWANDWLDHAMYEGGIGFKKSHASNEPDAAISGDDVMRIVEENPERWARIIGNAKKFYSGKGTSTNFESDESYPIKLLGGKTVKGSEWTKGRSKRDYPLTGRDSAPRILTGDCKIKIRKEKPKLTGDTKIRIKK